MSFFFVIIVHINVINVFWQQKEEEEILICLKRNKLVCLRKLLMSLARKRWNIYVTKKKYLDHKIKKQISFLAKTPNSKANEAVHDNGSVVVYLRLTIFSTIYVDLCFVVNWPESEVYCFQGVRWIVWVTFGGAFTRIRSFTNSVNDLLSVEEDLFIDSLDNLWLMGPPTPLKLNFRNWLWKKKPNLFNQSRKCKRWDLWSSLSVYLFISGRSRQRKMERFGLDLSTGFMISSLEAMLLWLAFVCVFFKVSLISSFIFSLREWS